LAGELTFAPGGDVDRRANQVLEECRQMLRKVADIGMFAAIEAGMFADTVRPRDGGKGLDGVIRMGDDYFNPITDELSERLGVER
jgi:beta-lysine 5,6-aminomutase alpha subunit